VPGCAALGRLTAAHKISSIYFTYLQPPQETNKMASLIQHILACITGAEPTAEYHHDEKHPILTPQSLRTTEETASRVVQTLTQAEKSGKELEKALNDIVGECGWTEKLVEWVLIKLEQTLRSAEKLSPVLREAYNKSCVAAMAVEGFVRDHPVFCTLIAIGVLVIIAPWMIEVLGFGELGPIEGTLHTLTSFPLYSISLSDGYL
jgi:hypothetical protein